MKIEFQNHARRAARRDAVWQRHAAESDGDFPSHVLLDQQGRLLDDEVERLLGARDDRPLRIAE